MDWRSTCAVWDHAMHGAVSFAWYRIPWPRGCSTAGESTAAPPLFTLIAMSKGVESSVTSVTSVTSVPSDRHCAR